MKEAMEILIFTPQDGLNDILGNIISKEEFKPTFVKTEKEFLKKLGENEFKIAFFDVEAFSKYDLVVYDIVAKKENKYLIALIHGNDTFSISEGLRLGIDDYVFKELPYSALLSKLFAIRRTLNKITAENNKLLLSAYDVTLNVTNRFVKRADKEISLTNKEFLILQELMKHKNNIVPRDDILSKFWNNDNGDSTNIVDVYINFIRKKLHVNPDSIDIIKTIRGIGYIIQESE